MNSESTGHHGYPALFDIRKNWMDLVRRSASQEPVVDGVRALATTWVVGLHMVFFHFYVFPDEASAIFAAPATAWLNNGLLGLDMFFTISGYLIGSILFSEYKKTNAISFSQFYVRRFLRLIPVYTAVMCLALFFLHDMPGMPVWGNAENFWANILYVNNFLPVAKQYMGWCWSLAIEEQFYLLLPAFIVVFMAVRRGRVQILIGLIMLSLAIRYGVIHESGVVPPFRFAPYTEEWAHWFDVVYDKTWMRFGGLIAGVTGAYLSCYCAPQIKQFFSRTALVAVISIGCVLVNIHIASTDMGSAFFDRLPPIWREIWWAVHHDVFSVATMFVLLASVNSPRLFGGALRRFLSWKGFYPVAQLSYSIYLVHEMLFTWLFPRIAPIFAPKLGGYGALVVDGAIGLLITLGIAITLYVLIERPCMRVRKHPSVTNFIHFLSRPKVQMAVSE